jgi:hypothetical protein
MWSSPADFPVLATLEQNGPFEEAVDLLLQQYDAQYLRPVGTLHLDPSGNRTLVIQTWEDRP